MLTNSNIKLSSYDLNFIKVLHDLLCKEFKLTQYDKPIIGQDICMINMIEMASKTVLEIVWQRQQGVSISIVTGSDVELMTAISKFLDEELSKDKYSRYSCT